MAKGLMWILVVGMFLAASAPGAARAQTPAPAEPTPLEPAPPEPAPPEPALAIAWARRHGPQPFSDGGISGNSYSSSPVLADGGRYLAFQSNAYNLIGEDDTNYASDVFVHDLQTGATERLSETLRGAQSNGSSYVGCISANGRYVAFESLATNLLPGEGNISFDIFLRDRWTGALERITVSENGWPANSDSNSACVSDDGRFVSFSSYATNLTAGDSNWRSDIFVRDRLRGVTQRVSLGLDGRQTNGSSWAPALTPDGRFVAFESAADNLVHGDTNNQIDVFVVDRFSGTMERVSVAGDGSQAEGTSMAASISDDGRFVAFQSSAANLTPGDSNGSYDIFVRDRQTGETRRISTAPGGGPADGESLWPVMAGNGRYVLYPSAAANLVPGDANDAYDIFLYDFQAGRTEPISLADDEAQGNNHSWQPAITPDGRYVVFDSAASNLTLFDMNATTDVFVRDRAAETTTCISCMVSAVFFPLMTFIK